MKEFSTASSLLETQGIMSTLTGLIQGDRRHHDTVYESNSCDIRCRRKLLLANLVRKHA
jgi:hypothetical protein